MAQSNTREAIRVMLVSPVSDAIAPLAAGLREYPGFLLLEARDDETWRRHLAQPESIDVVVWHDTQVADGQMQYGDVRRVATGCPILVVHDGDEVSSSVRSEFTVPTHTCSGSMFVSLVRSLSALSRAEASMHAAREELAQVGLELARSGTALANQLRRPVVNVVSAARRLRAIAPSDESTAELLGVINECAAQLHHSVSRLASMERVDDVVSDPSPVDLDDIIDRSVRRLQPILHQSRVVVERAGASATVWGDGRRLDRLVESLVVEMCREAANTSTRTMRVQCELERAQVRLRLEVPLDQPRNTPGHRSEELPEAHVTSGLSIPWDRAMRRRIIEAHRGSMGRTSTEHAVSTWFTLPRPLGLRGDGASEADPT